MCFLSAVACIFFKKHSLRHDHIITGYRAEGKRQMTKRGDNTGTSIKLDPLRVKSVNSFRA